MFHATGSRFLHPDRTVTKHNVGSDILLARHGDAIAALRPDRSNDRVVAILADGSLDSAPNLIDPALTMPGRMNDDRKLIAMVCAGTAALALVMTTALTAYYSVASPEQLANLTTIMGSITPPL